MAQSSSLTFTVQTLSVVNRAPVWSTIPTIAFAQGIASRVSIADYVTDPDGDPVAIVKNAVTLPVGVTYDAASKSFLYDGSGPVGVSSGNILTGDDGKP
jgi:hypothetical protein